MKKFIFISILTFIFAKTSFATVESLYVNHLTKEYQSSDNGCLGWIGWESIPTDGKNWDDIENKLIKEGYTEMTFPFKIELLIIGFIISVYIAIKWTRQRLKKNVT